LSEIVIRFLVGGAIVSAFAVLGDMFKPKSFAGLFGAAPSVALSTLTLTIAKDGRDYAAVESRSMIVGAIAFFIYATFVSRSLVRHKGRPLPTTARAIGLWLASALALWFLVAKLG
jgi:uncharacterized membrane protein (GlpM family)